MKRDLTVYSNLDGFSAWLSDLPDRIDMFFLLDLRAKSFVAALSYIIPELEEVGDLILRHDPNYDRAPVLNSLKNGEITASRAEFFINKLRIKDIFFYDPEADKLGSGFLSHIAHKLHKSWKYVIPAQFPERQFCFGILDEEVDPVIYFYTERSDI